MQKIDVRALSNKYKVAVKQAKDPIPFDTLWGMFKDALKHIEKVCSPMVWDTGIMRTPEYRKLEDAIDEVWLACMRGEAGLEKFQDTLKEWQGYVQSKGNYLHDVK